MRWVLLITFIFSTLLGNEGLHLFQEKRYEEALIAFQDPNNQLLMGQLYCNVALGNESEIDRTTKLITQAFLDQSDCTKPKEKKLQTQEEHLLTYQCRRHVREIARQMRQTVEHLVQENVPGFFQKIKMLRKLYPFIDSLEQIGIDCCQSGKPWECCLDPMLEQLESWKAIGIEG